MKLLASLFLASTLFLTSCGVLNKASRSESDAGSYSKSYILRNTQPFHSPDFKTLALTKATFKVKAGKQNIKFNGSVQIDRGDFISLSFTHLFGIEVFKAVFLPNNVYVVSKLTKKYYEFTYEELCQYAGIPYDPVFISYATIESFLVYDFSKLRFNRSGVSNLNSPIQVNSKLGSSANAIFNIFELANSLQVDKADIATSDSKYAMSVDYSDFSAEGEESFPLQMQLQANDNAKELVNVNITAKDVVYDAATSLNLDFVSTYKKSHINLPTKK